MPFCGLFRFRISDFEFVSDFDIRISDLSAHGAQMFRSPALCYTSYKRFGRNSLKRRVGKMRLLCVFFRVYWL
jgi:hypothetical protein